jgi:PAS domain S-box-containing protein
VGAVVCARVHLVQVRGFSPFRFDRFNGPRPTPLSNTRRRGVVMGAVCSPELRARLARGCRILHAAILIGLAMPVGATADPVSTVRLTVPARIRELKFDAVREARPVALEGIVVGVDGAAHTFFLTDGSSGILVKRPDSDTTPLSVRDRVRVTGVTWSGGLAPAVAAQTLQVIGRGSLPRPLRASVTQLASGMLDAQFVEAEGVIRSIAFAEDGAVANVAIDNWEVSAEIRGSDAALRDLQVDTHVRLRGVCAVRVDERHRPIGVIRLLVADRSSVDVLDAGTGNPFSAPAWPIADLAEFGAQRAFGRLIHIRGSVVLQRPGISLFVKDRTGSIYAETEAEELVKVGDVVDVIGFLANVDGPTISRASFRVVEHGPAPVARHVASREIAEGGVLDELVRLRAKLTNAAPDSLALAAGDLTFFATLDGGGLDTLELTPGSEIDVTGVGIVTLRDGKVSGFKMRLRDIHDVTIVRRAWLWSFARVMGIVGAIGAGALLLVVWNLSLKRKVRVQTDIIRRRLEHEAHLEARYSELIEQANDMHVMLDLEQRITSLNRHGEAITGFARRELIGAHFTQLVADADDRQGVLERPIVAITTKDGRRVVLDIHWQEIVNASQVRSGWQGFARDVTGRREAEDALVRAKEAAEASTRAKSEFLANMSHEIRTPMNGILGMTELALATELTREQRDYLDSVQSSGRSLLAILDDVLDLSRIEAGRMPVDPVPTNVRQLFAEVLPPLVLHAHRKDLAFHEHVEIDVPDWVVVDPVRVRQILVNLVANAVKFTGEGLVRVDLSRAEEDDAPNGYVMLHLAVRDTGIGVPADKQALIFEAFAQADGSIARRHGGTGLGLSICAKLVQMLGGRLWLESTPGIGSCFHVVLPVQPCAPEPPRQAPALAPVGASWRALVVDDNPVNLLVARRLLQKLGHVVQTADAGQAALDLMLRDSFDVVFMDVQMPGMNGFEATAEIRRRQSVTESRIPIVAVTAHAMAGDRERCLAAGMDEYVTKPVNAATLAAALERVMTSPADRFDVRPDPPLAQSTAKDTAPRNA